MIESDLSIQCGEEITREIFDIIDSEGVPDLHYFYGVVPKKIYIAIYNEEDDTKDCPTEIWQAALLNINEKLKPLHCSIYGYVIQSDVGMSIKYEFTGTGWDVLNLNLVYGISNSLLKDAVEEYHEPCCGGRVVGRLSVPCSKQERKDVIDILAELRLPYVLPWYDSDRHEIILSVDPYTVPQQWVDQLINLREKLRGAGFELSGYLLSYNRNNTVIYKAELNPEIPYDFDWFELSELADIPNIELRKIQNERNKNVERIQKT